MSQKLDTCPRCGSTIQAEAPQGLCPKCLLAAVSMPTEGGTGSAGKFTAPSIAEIAPAFPQLEILELIGQGGMGVVFKARQPKLDRVIALKILPQSLAADAAFAERFTREGRVLARLNHPNIVTVHDFGQANGYFYLTMEYVDGANLRQAMKAGRFTPDQALAVVPKVCEALQYAHNEGILHRDIKPENILLDAKGRVKIADFGIAKLVGEPLAEKSLTASGARLGTPHYMAPEQIEKPSDVDHRADIYSLGVVFYEMLTGELPLGRFARPSEKSESDPRLDEVVFRTLEKEPGRRQQSAGDVKTQVENITSGETTPAWLEGDALPGEWQIRCATCGNAKPFGALGGVRLGAASIGKRKLVNCSICGGLREGVVERAGASPIGGTPPPMNCPQLKIGPSYITTPEHLATFEGQMNLYRGRGELRLDDTQLCFSHQWHSVAIPLRSIKDLSIGHFPWTMKPTRLDFLCITFEEGGGERRLLFTPHESRWMPTWHTNEVVAEWFTAVRAAIIARTGHAPASTPAAQLKIPKAPPWMRVALGALVIAPIMMVGGIPLSFAFRANNDGSLLQVFAPMAVMIMPLLVFSVVIGWIWSRKREQGGAALSHGPRASGFWSALFILAAIGLAAGISIFVLYQGTSAPPPPQSVQPALPKPVEVPPPKIPIPPGNTAKLESARSSAYQEYVALKTKYEKIMELPSRIRSQALASSEHDPVLDRLITRINQAKNDQATNEKELGSKHPETVKIHRLIQTTELQIDDRTTALVTAMKEQLESARAILDQLQAEVDRRKKATPLVPKEPPVTFLATVPPPVAPPTIPYRTLQIHPPVETKEMLRETASNIFTLRTFIANFERSVAEAKLNVKDSDSNYIARLESLLATVKGKSATASALPNQETMQTLGPRIAEGDSGAMNELVQLASYISRSDAQIQFRDRLDAGKLVSAVFKVLGDEAGKGKQIAFYALIYSLDQKHLKAFVPTALGIAAAAGHQGAMDLLLHHSRWEISRSTAVLALWPAAGENRKEAVDFLISIIDDPDALPDWKSAAFGLKSAAEAGNARARIARNKAAE